MHIHHEAHTKHTSTPCICSHARCADPAHEYALGLRKGSYTVVRRTRQFTSCERKALRRVR